MAELPVKKPENGFLQFSHQIYHHHHGGGDGKAGGASAAMLAVFSSINRRRVFLLSLILSVQLFLLFLSRSISTQSSPDFPDLTISFSGAADVSLPEPSPETCPQGLVYVYDLPPSLNKDLITSCEKLSPWGSRCAAVSNAGFGPPAGDLAGLLPPDLLSSWFSTDQFSLELIFHRRMLNSRCRTSNASAAAAFFVPFYGGLAVGKYLWRDYSAADRDLHSRNLLAWLRRQNPYKKSLGWDHFMVLGRISWDFRRTQDQAWGSSFLYMPAMANITRLLIERNPWDYFDVGAPYPTGFHPRSSEHLRQWQNFVLSRRREALFSFAGGKRSSIKNDFREVLWQSCESSKEKCRAVDCSKLRCMNSTRETLSLFLSSKFCLQPRGDSFTRRSIFDCMVAGGIPVFFWKRSAYMQYQWFLPEDGGEYSVFIDREVVRNGSVEIAGFLEGIGEERVRRMREKVVELMPRIVYALPAGGLGDGLDDAFDVALDGFLRRVKEQRVWAPSGG